MARCAHAQGRLLRSILFPRQAEQRFVGDSIRFIFVMVTIVLLLYILDAYDLINHNVDAFNILVRFACIGCSGQLQSSRACCQAVQ